MIDLRIEGVKKHLKKVKQVSRSQNEIHFQEKIEIIARLFINREKARTGKLVAMIIVDQAEKAYQAAYDELTADKTISEMESIDRQIKLTVTQLQARL